MCVCSDVYMYAFVYMYIRVITFLQPHVPVPLSDELLYKNNEMNCHLIIL